MSDIGGIMDEVDSQISAIIDEELERMQGIAQGQCTHFMNVRIAEVGREVLQTWAGMNMSISTNLSGKSLSVELNADTGNLGRLEPLRGRIEAMIESVRSGISDDINRTCGYISE